MIKQRISFFIFSFTLLFFISGCASTKQVDEENPFADAEVKINPNTKKPYDFEGMNIVIGDWYTNPELEPKSTEQKMLKAWHEWTTATYNVNIIQKKLWGANGYFQMVKNYCVKDYVEEVAGNPDESYVFIIDESIAQQGVRAGLFYDLSTISNISYFDSVKYNQNAVNRLGRGHSFYSFGWEKNENLPGVYFNKRILQEHGYTSEYLYDLQAQGKWTWKNFENLCKKFTKDTDYDGDTDIWAMSSDMNDFSELCLASNGTSLVRKDVNGIYYNNLVSSKTSEAFTWMHDMWKKYQYPKGKNDNDDYCYNVFIKGKTAFLVGHQDKSIANHSLQNMMDDYGFICFPMGPRGDNQYNTVVNPKIAIIPSWYSHSRVEKIAKALDLYLTPVPTNSAYDAWKKNYVSLFRDARASSETLEIMGENKISNVHLLIKDFPAHEIINNVLTGVNTLEEENYFKKMAIALLLDENNNFGKLDDYEKITEKEYKEHIERELKLYEELKQNEQSVTFGDEELPEIDSKDTSAYTTLPVLTDSENPDVYTEPSETSDGEDEKSLKEQTDSEQDDKKAGKKKKNKKSKKAQVD